MQTLQHSISSIRVLRCYQSFGFYRYSRLKVDYYEFSQIKVPVPSIEEQNAIASFLKDKEYEIDGLIKIKQEKIETLKQYRQSLIFEAVTGKITVA